jgi:hypothetical protein
MVAAFALQPTSTATSVRGDGARRPFLEAKGICSI